MKKLFAALALATAALVAQPAPAAADSGFSQPGQTTRFTADEIVNFAKQVEVDLAAQGARVAIVFRSGRSREDLPEGISYTHGAFWVYQTITLADGRQVPGYAVYNLYVGDGDQSRTSSLVQDFPVDFVAGSAVEDVAIIIPTPEMQRRILTIMGSDTYAALHNPNYSLISNPHDLRFQNCNEFMLDVVAAAAWETTDREQIKANLREHFTPTRVRISAFERMFGPVVDERVRTEDHRGRRIATTTYESMAAFMTANTLASRAYVLQRDPAFRFEAS
jgi:hypothetical protein